MRIVFAGTSNFAVPSLRALVDANHNVVLVATQPDRPAGRGLKLTPSPVKQTAIELDLPLFQPERIRQADAIKKLREAEPDLLVVVAYGQILPGELLRLGRFGAINVHASLLPRYRGPAPIAWSILNGDKETGVTIMQMDEGVDTGEILAQAAIPLLGNETVQELEATLSELGARLLVKTLEQLERGEIQTRRQPEGASHAAKLVTDHGRLDEKLTATEIDRRVRALTPSPGCWMDLQGESVKILAGHPDGKVDGGIPVQTTDGVYVVERVQPPGKKPMSAAEWLRGKR
jgi:methionyl-tRNA formyltransferase